MTLKEFNDLSPYETISILDHNIARKRKDGKPDRRYSLRTEKSINRAVNFLNSINKPYAIYVSPNVNPSVSPYVKKDKITPNWVHICIPTELLNTNDPL